MNVYLNFALKSDLTNNNLNQRTLTFLTIKSLLEKNTNIESLP